MTKEEAVECLVIFACCAESVKHLTCYDCPIYLKHSSEGRWSHYCDQWTNVDVVKAVKTLAKNNVKGDIR